VVLPDIKLSLPSSSPPRFLMGCRPGVSFKS
jgi:hypothetical protein